MAPRPRILLQTSIPFDPDDWHVGRFSLLAAELARWADVTARNREPGSSGADPVILGLSREQFDREQYDQLWILAVDGGTAFTPAEIDAVNRFQRAGGGVLTARDHCNMGHSTRHRPSRRRSGLRQKLRGVAGARRAVTYAARR